MTKVSIEEASRDLRALIERVRAGEDIVIVDHDEVLARIEALEQRTAEANPRPKRQPGSMKDTLTVPARLMEPLSAEEFELVWGKENI